MKVAEIAQAEAIYILVDEIFLDEITAPRASACGLANIINTSSMTGLAD